MATTKAPNSRRHLDIAINRLAATHGDVRRIRLTLASTIVGQLLPSGAIKGGSALKIRFGNAATRFTRDLDAARGLELEEFIAQFRDRLAQGWNGFTGNVVRRDPAKPRGVPQQYVMQPFEVKLAYNQKSWLTVPLELGHDEIGDAGDPDYVIARDVVELFLELGFPAPAPVALMPLHHQIAQKLHGVSGLNSDRAHDLIDLQVIVAESDIDYRQVRETCARLFAYRQRQAWPPVVTKGEAWSALYENQIAGLSVASSVDDAIVWTNALIRRIDLSA